MSRAAKAPVLLVVVLLLVGGFLAFRPMAPEQKRVSAQFSRAVSVYVGSDVRILGVTVGQVTAVTPEGESVRVDMEYDAEHAVPADAQAVIVTPTLVSDRFVQLSPVWREGDDVLADGAEIALEQTGVPVELDRVYAGLQDLSTTLGPNGVNEDGSLNALLEGGAAALEGQGARLNRMITDLAAASQTFGEGSGDLFATVTRLADLTTTLAQNDRVVRAFVRDLAGVSDQLAGEKEELQALLATVGRAVDTVETFVRTNRGRLTRDVRKLSRVTRAIASQRDSLDDALSVGGVSLQNLLLLQDDLSRSVGARPAFRGNIATADQVLCAFVQQSAAPQVSKELACQLFELIIGPIKDPIIDSPARVAPFGGTGGTGGDPAPDPVPNPGAPTQAQSWQDLVSGGAG